MSAVDPARALDLLATSGPDAVLSDPSALAALADPGQWAGDVERALAALPASTRSALRRAGRAVLRAGRAAVGGGGVVPFPGAPPVPSTPPGAPLLLAARGGAWVRLGGRYCPVPTEVAVQELVRAGHAQLQVPTPAGGWRAMSYPDAYATCGALVSRVVYVLGAPDDRYDPTDGALYLGCATPDPHLAPAYHPGVARWLELLAGPRHGRLLDWLATAWDLAHPTAALYLEGGAGTGKSMLASALARCWGTGVTTYADVVLGTYSGALIRQPVVWLDERAPDDRNGKGTSAFRSLVGNRVHPYSEKYQASGTIQGCPRLVITSNNDDALRFGKEDLSRTDLEAIAARILHLEVDDAAAAYLATIDTAGWVEGAEGRPGAVCAHLAWLRDHHTVTARGARFLVEGDVGPWLRRQASQTGLAQDVLVALVRALTDLRLAEDPATHLRPALRLVEVVRDEAGAPQHATVAATDLHTAWPLLTGDRSGRVTVARLGRVLRGLAGHGAPRHRDRRHAVAWSLLEDACALLHGGPEVLRAAVGP